MDSYFGQQKWFKLKCPDMFLTDTLLFVSQDVNWWTGCISLTCGLLWCFYQLFGLSFWRHPFTAEDPLVSKWWNATFLQIWWRRKKNSSTSWKAWGWENFWQFAFLGELFQVKSSLLYCQFFHMYSTYIQIIEIALLSDPWCIQLTLNTDSRRSNTDKYSLTICTYKLYRYTNEDIVEK